MNAVGLVLIGRNEGERLRRCLESVKDAGLPTVYVDSGSSDGSVELARSFGADVVELSRDVPFTAARARNTGFDRLMARHPNLTLVQFADGDCRVATGWLQTAIASLEARPDVAVACGRRREAHPGASIYNRLCDLEWDTPVGEARSCGGDAMMRVAAFKVAGGFDPEVIAGEEPELCVRLRRRGHKVLRLEAEMTLHDAAMTRFSQWWRRTLRAGHAYAEGAARHGLPPERHCVRDVRSIIFWAGVLPLAALAAAWWTFGVSVVVLLAVYGVQAWRIAAGQQQRGRSPADARLYGAFTMLGKFPQLLGMLSYHLNRARGRRVAIIEYKGDPVPGGAPVTATAVQPAATKATPAAPPALRLAYLTTKYPAVSHTFIRREIRELERRGHHVLRLAIRPGDAAPVDPADMEEQSRTTHALSQPRSRLLAATFATAVARPFAFLKALGKAVSMARRSDRGLVRHLAYLAEACYLLRLVQRERVVHLHVHFGTNAAAVALLMRIMGGPPYSMTVHGPDEFDAPVGLSLEDKVAGAAFVVAITNFCASQIRRWSPLRHWSKVHTVGCTVGEEFFDAAMPIDAASRTLVCVGRLNAQKGHLLLLEAFARVARSVPDARLVLAGDGELRSAVESRIGELGLRERVEITGWISEAQVRQRILGSRALVMSSFAEGLPMVLMEALALGRPVIAPAIAGIPELVKPGESGWLVTAGSVDELAEAIREALSAPVSRLETMARAGRELVRRDHHTATETAKLESLLLNAMGSA